MYKYSNGRGLYARRGYVLGGGSRQAHHRIPHRRWPKIIAAPAAWDSMSRRAAHFRITAAVSDSPLTLSVCHPGPGALTSARASRTWPQARRATRLARREHRMLPPARPPVRLKIFYSSGHVPPVAATGRAGRRRVPCRRPARAPASQTNASSESENPEHSHLFFFV